MRSPLSHARASILVPLLLGAVLFPGAARPAQGQNASPAADEDAARQQLIVARFLTVLERNPRRGTALDKIYGFHIENGTIEDFVKQLRARTSEKPHDGAGWMILGLFESQRGRDAAAVESLAKAKDLRPADPLAAYYLGQSLVLVGQPEKAVPAFEEAVARKPAQADMLEIFQALGRVHQRAARTQEALAVWSRLEKLFPGDPRVQEQIAITLVEEGQPAEALPRYEALAASTTDDYRRTTYRMDAAELKIKLNRASDGIADLEQLLVKLNPESWLFREVRRKIEDVYLRTGDQDGLANYYASWLEKNPEDIEAMGRLARTLARQARVPEAQQWLDKALKLAPSRKELRLAFIEQLVDDQRYAEAAAQYAELDKADPNNPDYLRDWGKLVLRDKSQPKEAKQAEAERIWRRLVAARPADPLIATQVADLFRHAEMQPQALELYEKAVELAPGSPQYLEYLGEYYHILKRRDEALATWRKMTEGKQRTAANLLRLGEVLAQFGYLTEALPEVAAACELEPKDYALQLKAADFAIRADKYDDALASLSRADGLAQNDEEREAVLTQQIKTYTLQERLSELAADLSKAADGNTATHKQLFLLARYREALHEYPEATKAIESALAAQPNDIRSLAAAARIAEQAGDLRRSADLNRKLAVVDRRGRLEYLQHIATLETQLGRIDEALAAGNDLIAASPGNVETYQFFADLCFRLGKADDGIAALRRATRANPNEPALLLSLAAALAGQFRSDEAIELYWQAFEKGKELDDKLNTIGRLTELYLQTNRLDQLLERLERGRREADQRREMTICLAQAYQSAGDYGMARQELERLLSEQTRDTQLLLQLSKLAESENDLTTAVKYQEQLAKLAPASETEYRLASLLSRAGDNQEASAILVRLAAKEEDKEKLLRNIDGLLGSGQEDTAIAVLEPKLRENPDDWELLYRLAVALVKRRPADAKQPLAALLDLSLSDEELSAAAKARQAMQRRTGGTGAMPMTTIVTTIGITTSYTSAPVQSGPFSRLSVSYELRQALGIDNNNYGMSVTRSIWTPPTFGQARMASLGWLYRLALDANDADAFVAERRKQAEAPNASPRQLWDWVYLQTIRNDQTELLPFAKRLAQHNDLAGQFLFLQSLMTRNQSLVRMNNPQTEDRAEPLTNDELELMHRSFKAVETAGSAMKQAAASVMPYTYLQRAVLAELRRAGKTDEEQRLYRELIAKTDTTQQIAEAMQTAMFRNDVAAFSDLFDRFTRKDLQNLDLKSPTARTSRLSVGNLVAQVAGETQTTTDQSLALLDSYLNYAAAVSNQQRSNPLTRPSASGRSPASVNYIYAVSGGTRRRANVSFPPPNAYYDSNAITLLRTVYEQFKHKDVVSDLVKHFEARQTSAAGDKVFALLGLAYLQIWNDEPDAGAKTLAEAVAAVPQDIDLRMDVARYYMQNQQLDEALALVDAVTPLDQRVLEQRETLALDLAVRLGDQDRAHHAAERLFGLRLTPETQVELATQMRRLGMADEAEAVIARAQRQAGNRLSALAALMGQYQSQGRMDVAVQVAHQILRRSRTQQASQQLAGVYSQDSQYRTSALQCLTQAGKLKELIAAVESQLDRSPNSSQLVETLAEYYQAAGASQKMLDLQAKVVELRPEDPELRFRYARELSNRGKHTEACDNYLVALKKQPRLMGNQYWEVTQTFQQARREMDLVKLLTEIDIRSIGQPYVAVNLIQNLRNRKEGREAALELLKKAWVAYPTYRANLMNSFNDSQTWSNPEVFEFGKQAVIPTADAARQSPWYGVGDIMYYSGDGKIHTVLLNLLDAGAKNNKLPEVREQAAKAAAEIKEWRGGSAVVALIDLKLGKKIDPQAAFATLLSENSSDYRLQYARWVVGQEIIDRADMQKMAVELLRLTSEGNLSGSIREFRLGPSQLLVRTYGKLGQRAEVERLLDKAIHERGYDTSSDPVYNSYRRAEDLMAIGRVAEELNFPVEGLRVYRELITDNAFADPQLSRYGRNVEQMRQQAKNGIDSITAKLAEDRSGEAALALLKPLEQRPSGAAAVDLMLATPSTSGAMPVMESTLAKLLKPQSLSPAAAQSLDAQLAKLSEQYPSDVSVRVAQTLVAMERDPGAAGAAVKSLDAFIAATPLEELKPGQRANSRQRAEAAQQIGLWLVARHCLRSGEPQDGDLQNVAQRLADRAVAAARRQTEPAMLAAVVYEKGLLSLSKQDRATAERDWNELIDLAIVQPRKPRTSVAASNTASPAVGNSLRGVPVTGGNVAPAALGTAQRPFPTGSAPQRPTGPIPATLSQFSLAASIAQSAAEHGMTDLSLRAVREALSGGLPVPDLAPQTAGAAPVRVLSRPTPNARPDIDTTVISEVSSRMWQLSIAWRQTGFPAEQVCGLLESLVFARPGNIVLYEQPIGRDWQNPRSVGRLLVEWTVRAGRADELVKQIDARKTTPGDELAGKVLLVQLNAALGQSNDAKRDEAKQHLAAISSLLDSGRSAGLAATASHAVGAALADPLLASSVTPVLEKINEVTASTRANSSSAQDPLVRILVRQALARQDFATAKKHVDQYLTQRQSLYGRYSGDYGLYIQRQDLAWATGELARAGDLKTTLEMLARFSDSPKYARGGDPSIANAIWHLTRQAQKLPAEERYASLREWTLPTKDRRNVRVVAGIDQGQSVPDIFLPGGVNAYEPTPQFGVVSNLTLLVQAAAESNHLSELKQLVEPLVAEKVPAAEPLGLLVSIALKEPSISDRLIAFTQATRQRLAKKATDTTDDDPFAAPTAVESLDWPEVLVAQAALSHAELKGPAGKLTELLLSQARKTHRSDLIARLERDLAEQAIKALPADQRQLAFPPPLAHWFSAPGQAAVGIQSHRLWTAYDDTLVFFSGQWYDQIYLRYPVTGEFEFSFDGKTGGPFAAPSPGYAGLVASFGGDSGVHLIFNEEAAKRPALPRNADGWNRSTVRVTKSGVQFLSAGRLLYEDKDPSRTSPWLLMQTAVEHRSAMKNIRITGNPIIPREVPLIERDRLEGWACWNGRLPPRISVKEPRDRQQDFYVMYDDDGQPIKTQNQTPDWNLVDGVLKGRLDSVAATSAEMRMYYHRPLLSGERIRYEFRYQPGLVEVHPAIGQVAFLLEPDGVRLHWITPVGEDNPLIIDADNAAVDAAGRRGPQRLPLKENDWNSVELSMDGDTVRLQLNGQLVCERPIEPTNNRRFAFFRYKGRTAAEVRDIVLTGDWPQSLPAAGQLLAAADGTSNDAVARVRQALVGESVLADEAYAVWQRAMSLPAEQRYAMLKDWVLPGPTHPALRLQVDWLPLDAAVAGAKGGDLISPALELVATAKQLGKLDEVSAAAVLAIKEEPELARTVNSFEALLAIARGDYKTANDRLNKAIAYVKAQPVETPLYQRHAEYLAAYAAAALPPARATALKLAQEIHRDQGPPRAVSAEWTRRAPRLRALLTWATDKDTAALPFESASTLTQWQPAMRLTAKDSGEGIGPAVWKLKPGEASFMTGVGQDAAYFAVPLRGDFEVNAQITTAASRGVRFVYAGIALTMMDDAVGVARGPAGQNTTSRTKLPTKITGWKATVDFRLVVEGGVLTAFVNDQQIHQETLPEQPDPWLAIESRSANQTGAVKSLRITGSPEVPREISLSGGFTLDAWSPAYYAEKLAEEQDSTLGRRAAGPATSWRKQGNEILATRLLNCEGSLRESVLQYHRPLAEDGEIEYEFFYEPGKTEVHPAIGRTAVLLRSDGAQVHRLSDAQYDRTGLLPDNASPVADQRPVPLKPGEWNRLKLTMSGDELKVAVNGSEVGRTKLPAGEQRTFGLFRYADQSAVRVRNIVHHGNWPPALPPVDNQELAAAK